MDLSSGGACPYPVEQALSFPTAARLAEAPRLGTAGFG
jgi:hypothetical protein